MKQLLILVGIASNTTLTGQIKEWLGARRVDIFISVVFVLLFAAVVLFSKSDNLFRSLFFSGT